MQQSGIRLVKEKTPHSANQILQCRRDNRVLAEIRVDTLNATSFDVVHLTSLDGTPDPADLTQVRTIVRALARPSDAREEELRKRIVVMMRRDNRGPTSLVPWDFLNLEQATRPDNANLTDLSRVTECVADRDDLLQVLARVFERFRVQDNVMLAVDATGSGIDAVGHARIRVMVHGKEHRFSFWQSAHTQPTEDRELYIVPSYHPAIAKEKRGNWMVNGATNGIVRNSQAIRYLLPPNGTTTGGHDLFAHGGQGWSSVTHPWKAEGTDFGLVLDPFFCRTAQAADDIAELIQCALGRDEKHYVEIIGGFHSPLEHPATVLKDLGLPLPAGCHTIRGSESHCVWTHRTLTEEGKLKGARIPKWFKKEAWLAIYDRFEDR